MNKTELKSFEKMLLEEKANLEAELNGIAQTNPRNRGGWEANSGNMEIDKADENEVADKFETLEENTGIATKLEDQLMEVNEAIERIRKGTYGICEKCGKPIEIERLQANPSARSSIKHSHK